MRHKLILVLILVLATFLRFYKLGSLPNSYTPDELAQGYTAYSIIQTGQDEWGSQNWLNLRSFGDYKPPLQTLLMIPSIKIFGLTPFAVRLPNAILAVVTIFITYLIAHNLFHQPSISLLSSLFMAVSPWSLPMSRIALEANLVVFVVSLALLLFITSLKNRQLFLFSISAVLFGLSLFTYHSAKIFTPVLLVILFFYFSLYKHKKYLISLIIIFGSFFSFNFYLNSQIKSDRTGDIAIFNPTDKWQYVSNSQYEIRQNGLQPQLSRVLYNKVTYLYETFFHHYFSYLSPQFLATNGAGETTYGMIPGYGVLGLIPAIGFVFALIYLIKFPPKSDPSKSLLLLLVIFLISPAIGAIAKGQYSANRVSLMMPFIQIFSAAGLVLFLNQVPKKFSPILSLIFTFTFILTTGTFLARYFYQSNQILAHGMLYGHQQANEYLQNHPADKIIYSRKLSEPQAYVAFFNQINPKIIQSESANWLAYETTHLMFLAQLAQHNLDKFIFKEINIPSDSQIPNTIIVGRPEEFRDVKPDHIIYYPDHSRQQPAIYIYHTKI